MLIILQHLWNFKDIKCATSRFWHTPTHTCIRDTQPDCRQRAHTQWDSLGRLRQNYGNVTETQDTCSLLLVSRGVDVRMTLYGMSTWDVNILLTQFLHEWQKKNLKNVGVRGCAAV